MNPVCTEAETDEQTCTTVATTTTANGGQHLEPNPNCIDADIGEQCVHLCDENMHRCIIDCEMYAPADLQCQLFCDRDYFECTDG